MTPDNNELFGEEQSTISLKERLFKYLAYWPLFLISTLLCLGSGVLYIKYTVPKYIATTTLLIKGAEGNSSSSADLIESALYDKREINLNNEMLQLSAERLMQRTVAKNNFNISYFQKGSLLNTEIHNDAPFRLIAKQITNEYGVYKFHITKIDMKGGELYYGPEEKEKLYLFKWNIPFIIDKQSFTLVPKGLIRENGEYVVQWEPVDWAASKLSQDLAIRPYDTKTSVITLSLKIANVQKGKEILNALITEFNLSDVEDRNKLSENTVRFINERLTSISNELEGVEGNLENYQGKNQLVDIKAQSAQSMGSSNEITQNIKELGVQQSVASMLRDYLTQPTNNDKSVPSSFGLNDPTLAGLIGEYNILQLKRDRETPMVAPNSTVMQDLNTQTESLKSSMLESLSNISKNLKLQESKLHAQNSQFRSFLSSVPRNERLLQEIKRKQSITESIYLYLLQKREEAAISSTASNVLHYKQIDPARAYGPIEPNTNNILLYTFTLGLFLAFGFVYGRDMLNDKITSKQDVAKRISNPILGQIGHIPKKQKQIISVLDRNIIGEQFRAIRTNLSFLLKDKTKKVILVTSTTSGEGKSFFSLNLAAVYAMPGKKVAYLELDIRKPSLARDMKIESEKGLTDYLSSQIDNLSEIRHVVQEIPTLHVYPAGPIPPNAADLLLTENLSRLFESLTANYDYVIIDSPPAGLVSDPFIMGQYSNIVLYMLRCQKTLKKQLDFISEIVNNKTLKNVAFIMNDMKAIDSYGYYYGSEYNYGSSNGVNKQKKKSVSI